MSGSDLEPHGPHHHVVADIHLQDVDDPSEIGSGSKDRVDKGGLWRRVRQHPQGVIGAAILLAMIAFCFLGPLVYPTDQTNVDLLNAALPPGPGHPLGTDPKGFDVLGRLMIGGQVSLEIGLLAAVFATTIGTLYGAVSGLAGGVVDGVLMRLVDVLLSIPFLFVVLILSTRFHANEWSLALVIGVFSWLISARLVRSEVLTLRVREYVLAARVMGASRRRIIARHLVPNAMGVIIVNVTFQVADAILVVAALGFLGFGLSYPSTDWGSQLADGVTYIANGYWWLIYPVGLCIVITVLSLTLLADDLRDTVGRRAD